MKKSLLLTLLVCCVFITTSYSQEAAQNLKEVFLDAEYFLLNENYVEALYSYNVVYKRGYAENGNINYRIGQCYLNIPGDKAKAIPYLEKASEKANLKFTEGSFKEVNAPLDVFFLLGNAYRINNQTNKAIAAYQKYKELIGPKNQMGLRLADKEIDACKLAVEMMKKPVIEEKINLGRPINSSVRDYFPVVSGDESELVYNSAQKFYDAVLFSKKVNDKWSAPVNITPEIQSDGDQYCSSLSYDGTELYLRKEDNFDANIMVARYENGKWTKSESLGKNINTKFWEGNAFVTKDGKTLYFSSNKTGGFGALDLYKSNRKSNEEWGPATNLGNVINSEFNEDAPFITEDGKRLFFVSQGHNTIGGYDIFYSDLDTNGQWETPVNLGYPINTTDDDLFFCPIKDGAIAYASSYSGGGIGSEDIFRIQLGAEPLIVGNMAEDSIKLADNQNVNKIGLVTAKSADTLAKPLSTASFNKVNQTTTDIADTKLPPANAQTAIMDTLAQAKERAILRCVFFDYNSALLTIKAKKELDHLAMVMDNYPALKIELIGNTDARGSDEYNFKLSEKRANSARQYLTNKGISSERISIKGAGKKNFVAINTNADGTDNPEGRVFNRRTDIQILEFKVDNIIIEEIKVPEKLQIKPRN
jgi:outer membrane protein OmpA-like peptidoglycan-associated protein/ribosomal protein L24E